VVYWSWGNNFLLLAKEQKNRYRFRTRVLTFIALWGFEPDFYSTDQFLYMQGFYHASLRVAELLWEETSWVVVLVSRVHCSIPAPSNNFYTLVTRTKEQKNDRFRTTSGCL